MEQGIAVQRRPASRRPKDPAAEHETLAELLSDLTRGGEGELTAQMLVDHLGRKGFGPLLLALGVPMLAPLPPGAPIIFALPLLIVCLQMVVGRQTVWLPRWIARKGIERKKLAELVAKVTPWVSKVEKRMSRRLAFLIEGPGERVAGLTCTVIAVVLVLPVPFANLVPSMAITAFGLAMARKDGLMAIAGYLLVALSVAVIWLCVHWAAFGWNHYAHHLVRQVMRVV